MQTRAIIRHFELWVLDFVTEGCSKNGGSGGGGLSPAGGGWPGSGTPIFSDKGGANPARISDPRPDQI